MHITFNLRIRKNRGQSTFINGGSNKNYYSIIKAGLAFSRKH